MKKTEHYQLSQWELSDRVLMNDFNRDNLLLDAALAALSGSLDAKDAAQSAALAAAREGLSQSIGDVNSALGGRITSLDTKQTNALSAAKSQLNGRIDAANQALTSSIAALDEKRQGLLDAARTALEAEDRRLDGCKLQWYRIKRMEIDVTRVTGVQPLLLDEVNLGDYCMVLFNVQLNSPSISILNHENDIVYRQMGSSSNISGYGLANAAAAGLRIIGFPMKDPEAPVRTISLGTAFTFAQSSVRWGQMEGLSLYNGTVGNTTPVSYKGYVEIYGIR